MRAPAHQRNLKQQAGAAIVEFALICGLLLGFVYALIEFGRMLYIYNTMQEISRRAAREAAVRWIDATTAIKNEGLFNNGTYVPGSPEITAANISIKYLQADGVSEVILAPADAGDNMSACNDILRTTECIKYVEVSVKDVHFTPMIFKPGSVLMDLTQRTLPAATTVVYAESLGFTN